MERHRNLRSLLVLLAIALLSVGAVACGSISTETGLTSHSTSDAPPPGSISGTIVSNTAPTSPTATPIGKDSDDGDDDAKSHDDDIVVAYGRPASEAETQAVTALIKRYYAAGAADDGPRVCSLIYGLITEMIPEDFAHTPGLHGKTCAAVMSKVFKHRHQQLVADIAKLRVTRVRVGDKKGFATVYLGTTPEPYVVLHREGGVWKMESLFEEKLP